MYLLPRFGWIIIWRILIKDFCHFALIHKGILFYLMVIYSVLILSYIKTNILLHVREDKAWNKFWRLYRSLQQSNVTSSIFNDPKVMLTIHYAGNLEFRNVIPIKKNRFCYITPIIFGSSKLTLLLDQRSFNKNSNTKFQPVSNHLRVSWY